MINRFQGDLAELLAVDPCCRLCEELVAQELLSSEVCLYWGSVVRQRRRNFSRHDGSVRWGGFTKGADGVIAEVAESAGVRSLDVRGVVEVKSMSQSMTRVAAQIDRHISRLQGGLKLGDRVWEPSDIGVSPRTGQERPALFRVAVLPASNPRRRSVDPDVRVPGSHKSRSSQIVQSSPNLWRISLGWSHQAIAEASYEMTLWFMSQIGEVVFAENTMPDTWRDMTPSQAGQNAIKQMLYFVLLRPLSARHQRIATRLYNTYGFGYRRATQADDMLWPE